MILIYLIMIVVSSEQSSMYSTREHKLSWERAPRREASIHNGPQVLRNADLEDVGNLVELQKFSKRQVLVSNFLNNSNN